jgi:hypothetical protein
MRIRSYVAALWVVLASGAALGAATPEVVWQFDTAG